MDPKRPPIWSADARADLSDIWDYYAGVASRRTADNIIRAIGDVARLIEDHPYGAARAMKFGQGCVRLPPHLT